MIGRKAPAATASLNIDFRRKPASAELIREARPPKPGRPLSTEETTFWPEGGDAPSSMRP